MKKIKETDISDTFKIKKPQVDEERVKKSWETILKRLNQPKPPRTEK
ncbi:MAG: hypothetical protein ACTHNW_06060 [Mucilaginibacter sp.]